MTEQSRDIALDTFLAVAKEVASDLPEDFLLRLYRLQKARQFETNREVSVQELQRALDEFISEKALNREGA
jgi:hypothetical protein